jgi:hypothetical protein
MLSFGARPALTGLIVAAVARIMLHFRVRGAARVSSRELVVLPLRDVLSLALWAWGFVNREVRWRDDLYRVTRDGSVQPLGDGSAQPAVRTLQ